MLVMGNGFELHLFEEDRDGGNEGEDQKDRQDGGE
jgi:hypothetical protein